MIKVEVLGSVRNIVGESPLWAPAEAALYWIDIDAQRLHRHDWVTQEALSWPLPERIGSIALHADGGLLAAMETGLFHLRPQAGRIDIECLERASFPRPDMRFNDGRCDREGRFWVSSMVLDTSLGVAAGTLYRYDRRGLTATANSLITGNGLSFSPDGRTMYLSDSHPSVQRVWMLDLDTRGMTSNMRNFIDMRQHPGRPDGAAVDAEGGYWICGNDAGMVHRFLPDGRLERSLRVPVSKPSMCAFGGPQLDHLFITSIKPARPTEGYDAALDGAVFVIRPGVSGIAETPFQP